MTPGVLVARRAQIHESTHNRPPSARAWGAGCRAPPPPVVFLFGDQGPKGKSPKDFWVKE